jgi:hypothetical protein
MGTTDRQHLIRRGSAVLAAWLLLCIVAFLRCGFWIGLALVPVNFFATVVVAPAVVNFVDGLVRGLLQ